MIKAIIFDMDGVVAVYQKQDFLAWKRIFKEYGLYLSFNQYLSFLGMKGEEIIRKHINPNLNLAEALKLVNRKEKYFVEELEKSRIKPTKGLKKLLKNLLKGNFKIGLGTSAPSYKTNIVLKKLGIKKFFNIIVNAEKVRRGKPNPEIYLKAAKGLDVEPKECIVIEDSPKGIESAKRAGMKCVAITTTHKKTELKNANKIIDSFNELTIKMIKNI